jgi:hypothetical protein
MVAVIHTSSSLKFLEAKFRQNETIKEPKKQG